MIAEEKRESKKNKYLLLRDPQRQKAQRLKQSNSNQEKHTCT